MISQFGARAVELSPKKNPSLHPYQIVSLGSDGQEGGTGTAADISNGETLAAAR
jgi:hypothetical protein